jgi:hypothetical protein
VLAKLKKVLTVLTNLLLIGRSAGWWSKSNTVETENKEIKK